MSSDGLNTHHERLVIPRLAQDIFILLFIEYHYNVDHQNSQRMFPTL
jgi:hypothetical protein